MSEAEDKVKEKDKERIMPNDIVWHEALLKEVCEKWLRIYSSDDVEINVVSGFFKGEIEKCGIGFKDVISDADLIRIGFLLGLSYDKQNIVFKKYRNSQGRKNRLNNNLCPKNKESFLGSDERVDKLSEILQKNGCGFVATNVLEDRIRKLNSYKHKEEVKLDDLKAELEKRKRAIELYEQRVASCENEKRR
jgi:hypothetical protein